MHPVIKAAGKNAELPGWAQVSKSRRKHVRRVAKLLNAWGKELGLASAERCRWKAAGLLHDVVKDARTSWLRDVVGDDRWPDALLHAPAAALLLEREGVEDPDFLRAIRFHSLGHPEFDGLGTHLYLADYLEPGRKSRAAERAALREQMPGAIERVLPQVVRRRLGADLAGGRPLIAESVAYWNGIASS